MAFNLSRIFKRTPEVAAGDVNGDGRADAAHDRYANQEVSYAVSPGDSGQGHGDAAGIAILDNDGEIEVARMAAPGGEGLYANKLDGGLLGINDQTPADWNERSAGGPEGPGLGDTATHEARLGNFEIQDVIAKGPSAVTEDMAEIVLNATGGQGGGSESALDAGFTISDDLVNEGRTVADGLGAGSGGGLGVKWEGPDFDATTNSLLSEAGMPRLEEAEQSFTSAEGRSMSFELLRSDGPGSGATERSSRPGNGLRDMEIDLGHGGTLVHDESAPDTAAIREIIQKRGDDAFSEVAFPKLDGSDKSFASTTRPFADGLVLDATETPQDGQGAGYQAVPELDANASARTGSGLFNPKEIGADKLDGPGGPQVGSGTDNANRMAEPGHTGDGFMMQDGELYPRGIEGAAGPLKWGTPGREPSNYASIEFASVRPESGSNDSELRMDLGGTQDGSGTDIANRMAEPGHAGDGFMMQDGELYPRGILPFMEGQNFTGSDEQMHQLLGNLREQSLIDTSTGEVQWVAQPLEGFTGSDEELGTLVSWLKDNRLIDTSTGEIVWARQPEGDQWFVPDMDSDQTGMRTTGPGAEAPAGFHIEVEGASGGYLSSVMDGAGEGGGTTPERFGLDNGFDQQGSSAGFKSLSGLQSETERVRIPEPPQAAGVLPFMEQSNVVDGTGTGLESMGGAGGTESLRQVGPDQPLGFDRGYLGPEGVVEFQDGEDVTAHAGDGGALAEHASALPEVDDEVLVGFSALDADADAPTTLVDLHSHTDGTDGLVGHVEIPHLDPGHHDLGGLHHGHGFMDYTDDAVIDH